MCLGNTKTEEVPSVMTTGAQIKEDCFYASTEDYV